MALFMMIKAIKFIRENGKTTKEMALANLTIVQVVSSIVGTGKLI